MGLFICTVVLMMPFSVPSAWNYKCAFCYKLWEAVTDMPRNAAREVQWCFVGGGEWSGQFLKIRDFHDIMGGCSEIRCFSLDLPQRKEEVTSWPSWWAAFPEHASGVTSICDSVLLCDAGLVSSWRNGFILNFILKFIIMNFWLSSFFSLNFLLALN